MAESQVIPREIQLYFQRGFTIGAIARVFPYVWSLEEGRPKLRKGWGNVVCWLINIILGFAYTAFVIGRCIQTNLDPLVGTGVKIYMRFCVVYYTFPTTYHLFILLKKDEFLGLSRHVLMFIEWVNESKKDL